MPFGSSTPEEYLARELGLTPLSVISQFASGAGSKRFKDHGLDPVDVRLGFNTPDVSGVPWGPAFMAPIAQRIKDEAAIATAVDWFIDDPHVPYHAAKALGVANSENTLPRQYAHWLKGR